jgi:hypothetical protein
VVAATPPLPVQERAKEVVNPKRRIESLDGTSPSREEPKVTLEKYKGIHLVNMNSILVNIFGESCCGRVRITFSDYTVRQSVLRDMCERLLQCSSEAELVKLLMQDCENAIKFMFYYAGRDNLYDCVVGDGFCALRNALVMGISSVPELVGEVEKHVVRARDLDLTSPDGLRDMLSFISDLLIKLDGDDSLRSKDNAIRESCLRKLTGMKHYLENKLPDVLKAKGIPFLQDTSLWFDPYIVPIISAYRAFKFTVFETTAKFAPTVDMTTNGLRWWLAWLSGDGVDSSRFHNVFTYRECSEIITKQARFCTTGVSGRDTQCSSKNGILCHFYPIGTHDYDMSGALDEAVADMAKAIHNNKDLMLIRYGYSTTTHAISQ